MSKWAKAFRGIEKTLERRGAAVVSGAALDLGTAIIKGNPVGDSESLSEHLEAERASREAAKNNGEVYQPSTRYVGGHSRLNWRAFTGDMPNMLEFDGVDPDGAAAIARMASVLRSVELGETMFIGNPVDYVPGLEYGASQKAPLGMVRINAANWKAIVSEAAKRERKR